MGMELEQCRARDEELDPDSLPRVLCVGSAGVGKATIANRLRQSDQGGIKSPSGEGATFYRWKIDTKYYTANVGIWTSRLEEDENEAIDRLLDGQFEALVMVFDLSNDASFDRLKNWASRADLTAFDILLCVGNKADRIPQHYGHVEYRRRLQRSGESSSDPHPEFLEFGIDRTEGSSLLGGGDDDPAAPIAADEIKHSRIEWCIENGIEYIEACALNDAFDECLTLDADPQGISRIRGALSAHMWPGMVMKQSPRKVGDENRTQTQEDFSSDSDFTIEYELLSSLSDDESSSVVDNGTGAIDRSEVAAAIDPETAAENRIEQLPGDNTATDDVREEQQYNGNEEQQAPSEIEAATPAAAPAAAAAAAQAPSNGSDDCRLDEFERLMQEVAGIRENLSSMPDTQRREIASQIAMRMASMFMGDDDDGDGDDE